VLNGILEVLGIALPAALPLLEDSIKHIPEGSEMLAKGYYLMQAVYLN
jgi:hypothetical protein